MRQSTTHGQFTRCSVCGQAGSALTTRVSQFGYTAGWHRTAKLCGRCSRLVADFIDALRQEARA